jgi:transposase
LSTKIHLAVRGLGCPVRFHLTAGHRGDAPQALSLIDGLTAAVVMADTAYDSDQIRQAIAEKGALAVIPNNPSRAKKHPLDGSLYAQRHLVECCIGKLKQFRRVATRFEKTARNYLAVVTLAAIVLWLR